MSGHGQTISASQFYTVFFLSRIFGLLTFVNGSGARLSAKNGALIALSFIPFALLAGLPPLLVSERGAPLNKPLLYAYGFFFLLHGAEGAALLDLFLGETMFSPGGHAGFLLFFCFFAAAAARCGIQAPARAAKIVLWLFLISMGLLFAATAKSFEPENLTPLSDISGNELFRNGFAAAMRTAEPAALLILAPQIRGRKRAGLAVTAAALGAAASLLFFWISGTTGAFGETQTFQLFTLTTLAEFGTVERMDDVMCALWIFCAFLRTVFDLCAACACFARREPETDGKRVYPAAAVLYACYLALRFLLPGAGKHVAERGTLILNAVFVICIPLAIGLKTGLIKNRRRRA